MITVPNRGSDLSTLALTGCLALIPLVLCATTISPRQPAHGNVNDFVAYWTAAHQVLEGNDPYATEPVLALEREVGFTQSRPLIMRNPPWTVPFIALFGLLPFSAAREIWLGAGLVAIFLSARWLWGIYQVEEQSLWTAWLVIGLFLPVGVVLAIGQIGPLVLLGIAGFLHF